MTFKVCAVYTWAVGVICIVGARKADDLPTAVAFLVLVGVCAVVGTRYAIRGWRRV